MSSNEEKYKVDWLRSRARIIMGTGCKIDGTITWSQRKQKVKKKKKE